MNTKNIASLKESAAALLDQPVVSTNIIKSKRNSKKNCQVFCKETNTLYESITSVAKELGIDSWTMGKKMTAAGCFIDENGNTYQRMTPMKSKNVYANTGASLKKCYLHRTPSSRRKVVNTIIPTCTEVVAPSVVHDCGKSIAKKILAKEVMNYISSEKYDSAADLLEVIRGIK